MPDISSITLPSGTTYNLKDEVARAAAAAGMTITKVDELPTASASTLGAIYLVPKSGDAPDVHDEYITVKEGNNYSWELIGSTSVDMSGYSEDGHTHSVTTNVGVAQHTGVLTGGSVTSTFTGAQGAVSVSGTPQGGITSQGTFSGKSTTSTGKFTPSGNVSGTAVSVTTKNSSGGDITVYSMSSTGSKNDGSYSQSSYTQETYTVSGENLTIGLSSYTPENVTLPTVTLPGRTAVTFGTSVTDPTFTGTQGDVSVSGTPLGDISGIAWAGQNTTFGGNFTPSGDVDSTFSPTTGSLTHSVTNNTVTSGVNDK